MISVYQIGRFLVLLQTCYSQCSAPFDPKTLIVSNYKNSSLPGFNLLRNADIAMCMMICYKFKLCRSVDWIQEEETCRLNSRFVIKNDNSLITKGPTFHVEREDFPVHLAGNCLNNICAEDEICIGGKCVQVLKDVTVCGTKTSTQTVRTYTLHIVIQKREDGDVDFYRTWIEYKEGFGNPSKNYWIGNDAIHTLTREKDQELRVDLHRHNGEQAYAVYTTFYILDEDSKYNLTVSGYNGTAGDSLTWHNGARFSTKDQDNDTKSDGSCAVMRHGAWWYHNCFQSNLNGEYAPSVVFDLKYPVWKQWKGSEAL